MLQACQFNTTHGWSHAGRPQSLQLHWRFPDGEAALGTKDLVDDPRQQYYKVHNSWRFVGAEIDQGFLFYMFWVRSRTGANFRYHSTHKILHWWHLPKPWLVGRPDTHRPPNEWPSPTCEGVPVSSLSRAYTYLGRSRMLHAGDNTTASPCAHALWLVRRAVEDDPRFHELPLTLLGINVPFFPLRRRTRA